MGTHIVQDSALVVFLLSTFGRMFFYVRSNLF